jgi:hypothetical protein
MNKKQSERPVILRTCLFGIGVLIVLAGGCHQPGHPRQRVGAFFGSPAGIYIPTRKTWDVTGLPQAQKKKPAWFIPAKEDLST